jgi:hypothetical protein
VKTNILWVNDQGHTTSLFAKQNNLNIGASLRKQIPPITHAAFELISGHFEGQFKTSSQKKQRQPLNSCLITSRDNLWENSETHANNISISFLATSKANLGKTSIKNKAYAVS